MNVIKKLLLSFSVIILLSTSSIVFADGHGKCKPSKWEQMMKLEQLTM